MIMLFRETHMRGCDKYSDFPPQTGDIPADKTLLHSPSGFRRDDKMCVSGPPGFRRDDKVKVLSGKRGGYEKYFVNLAG